MNECDLELDVIDVGELKVSEPVVESTSKQTNDCSVSDSCGTFDHRYGDNSLMKENSDTTSHALVEQELNITDDEAMEFSDVITAQPNRDHSDHALCYKCGKFQECACNGGQRLDDEHSYADTSSVRLTVRKHSRTGVPLTRKRTRNMSQWKSVLRKKLRQSGKPYVMSSGE